MAKTTRTAKDIERDIAMLEKELNLLKEKEFAQKMEPLMDVLKNTTLTVPQIKKAIKDAEKEKGKSTKERKRNNGVMQFKAKTCKECGKEFTPKSGRQVICDDCKAKKVETGKSTKDSIPTEGVQEVLELQ